MKKRIAILLMVTALPLSLYGCSKGETEPVTSENVEVVETEESETEEPEAEPEESEANTEESLSEEQEESIDTGSEESTNIQEGIQGGGGSASIEADGEYVGNTTLTQDEIDSLKANASTDAEKKAIDAYESITQNGTWNNSQGVPYTKVVGNPADTSWRKLSDEEVKATLDKGDPGYLAPIEEQQEYEMALRESQAGQIQGYVGDTVYYDFYAYCDACAEEYKDQDDGSSMINLGKDFEEAMMNGEDVSRFFQD